MLKLKWKHGILYKLWNTPYKHIQLLEREDNEKGNIEEAMGVETTMEGTKQISKLEEDEDGTSLIKNLIRK